MITKKQKRKYFDTLATMNVESLKSLANNGRIYMLSTKEEVADLLSACRIEGINPKGYQFPDIQKTELPVFFAFATFEGQTYFLLHSRDYRRVWREIPTALKNAMNHIQELNELKNQMQTVLKDHPKNDIAYTFPHDRMGYVHEDDIKIIPYPDDYPVLY